MSPGAITHVEGPATQKPVTAIKATHPLNNRWKALVPIIAGVALLFVPVPEGLKPNAWYYFALFVAVIIALNLEPIPAAAVGLIGSPRRRFR